MSRRPHLRRLADRVGILPSYIDVAGERRVTKDVTRAALLEAMKLDASTESAAAEALATLDREDGQRILDPVRVLRIGSRRVPGTRVRVSVDLPGRVDWRVELREQCGVSHVRRGRARPRGKDRMLSLPLPARPSEGYHTLHVTLEASGHEVEAEQSLIVSPGRCILLRERVGDRRVYGLWSNLYSFRSERNWGVGDLTDLGELISGAASHGAAFVGVNPLHAIRNRGRWIGPYCPVSRLFRNFIYVDVGSVPEFANCGKAQRLVDSAAFRADLSTARSARLVQYEGIARLKADVLRMLHGSFVERHGDRQTDRGRAYHEYVESQGKALIDFATFAALEAWLADQGEGGEDWHDWPAQYRAWDSPEVEAFRKAHRRDVDFHCYVQFEMDRQLGLISERARETGMALGVYQDLAIGSACDGSDAWAFPTLLLGGVKVGAPPDPFAKAGQTWGFPPVDPRQLRATGYDYWIRLLRTSLRHGGALRIDHVMGLFRQYWVPDGHPATQGAYVRFPSDDLLGILALESRRHGAVIIGEDLGTVPRELPSILARWGILSSRVMYFERSRRGGFRPARTYSKRALVTATTHDHPPLAGFWTGRDLEIRDETGLYATDDKREAAQTERQRTRAALARRLHADGLLQSKEVTAVSLDGLRRAIHRFLARTPAPLIGVSLDDLSGETEPVNLPGVTIEQYPSWSRRMCRGLAEVLSDAEVRSLLDELRETLDQVPRPFR